MSTKHIVVWVVLAGASINAQDQYRIFAPTKDVAMLVDVSVSVKKTGPEHKSTKTARRTNYAVSCNPGM